MLRDRDPDEMGSGIIVPSRLFSEEEVGVRRACREAEGVWRDAYQPLIHVAGPDGEGEGEARRWNVPPDEERGEHGMSLVRLCEPWEIGVDLSRDVLHFGALTLEDLTHLLGIPFLGVERMLARARRVAVAAAVFSVLRLPEERDSTMGQIMPQDEREWEVFEDMEACVPQAVGLLSRFESLEELTITGCNGCACQSMREDELWSGAPFCAWGLTQTPWRGVGGTEREGAGDGDGELARLSGIDESRVERLSALSRILEPLLQKRETFPKLRSVVTGEVVYRAGDGDAFRRSSEWYYSCRPTGKIWKAVEIGTHVTS
jgi:hypothetical protein